VHEDGVDYAAWKQDGAPALDAFLAKAAAHDPSTTLGKEPKTAFWLNVYNAWSVRQVLSHWPVARISDIPGFFDSNRVRLAGADMTLADMESTLARLLPNRPQFALGLVTGARGGPRLQNTAYTSGNLDSLLAVSIRDLIGRGAIAFSRTDKVLRVPPAVDHYWAAYQTFPHGFADAFASYLPLADLVAINSSDNRRVVQPPDATLLVSGSPPESAGKKQ
jgi:hypothetical protein